MAVCRYCEIYGLDCGDHIYDEGVSLKDPGTQLSPTESSVSPYGAYTRKDWKPRVYGLKGFFLPGQETDLEEFLHFVNSAPMDSKFYPHRPDRFGFIDQAHAYVKDSQGAGNPTTGAEENLWNIEGEVTLRDPWLWGEDQGIPFTASPALWYTTPTLVNTGHMPCTINYMQVSGDYAGGGYVNDLQVGFVPPTNLLATDRLVTLCTSLMRDDLFELGWRDGVRHSYHCNFSKLWAEIGVDLHGCVSGGTQAGQSLTLDDGDYCIMPFYGPLPVSGDNPYIELWVSALAGSNIVVYGDSMSNLYTSSQVLKVGYNKIYIPNVEGYGDLFIGVKSVNGAGNSITLTEFKGTVNRYIARSALPAAEVDEQFCIQLRCSWCLQLKFMQVSTNYGYNY